MKSLLARIGLPRAIGLYIDDQVVHLSQVVATPFGPVEITRRCENVGPDELPVVLERLVTPLLGRRGSGRVPVAIGLPAGRTYFSTRPIQNPGSDVSPHVLLREALRSSNVSVDEMVVDVIKARPDKRPVAGIVSCERDYLAGLLESLQQCGVRPYRAEPAPCALLRAAASRHRAGRRTKVVLRLFLDETRGLAVLAAGNLPLVWRSFSLPRGDEASALLSVSRSLVTMRRHCGIESPLDSVMLHGRPDLARLLDVDWVEQEVAAPVEWFDGPSLDGPQVAFGLALGCLQEDETAFDLAGTLKPRASLWELFPLRGAILQAGLLLCMGLFLADRSGSLERSYMALLAENAQHPWMASAQTSQLENEKRDLNQKVAALNRFLDSRITWTSYERDLAGCLPDNVFLTSFQGVSELGSSGKRSVKPKKSLVLRGAVSIPPDGSMPHAIDRFLDTLREHPMLKRDFPIVELAGLKQSQRIGDETPVAFFTVVCLPKGGKGPPR